MKRSLNYKGGNNIAAFESRDGWLFKYDVSTNEFAIGHPKGTISTFYKLKDGIKYWLEQVEKYMPR